MSVSIYYGILTAVQTELTSVVSNCVIRKKLQILDSSDTLPIVIIAPGAETLREQTFNKGVWYNYPVLIAYVEAGNRLVSSNLSAWMLKRESLRNQLFQPLLAGTSVFDANIDPEETIKFGEYLGSNYDVTGWKMVYTVAEQRVS